jgi:pheromone a factor receptor
MALSATEILGTIPLGTYIIVASAKEGVTPWKGWAYTHGNSSAVAQIAGFIWRSVPITHKGLEMFRWSLVACAFIFFAFFGFTDETRRLYRRVYSPIANRIGYSRFILHRPAYLCVVYSLS